MMKETASERIYVGGIEPPRLTVDQVLERLVEQLDEASIHLQLQTLHREYKYFHINATAAVGISDDGSTTTAAYDAIRKLFHNVVWRGCKLRVERARPHLLERLAQERQERMMRSVSQLLVEDVKSRPSDDVEREREASGMKSPSQDQASGNKSRPPTRRYLRIRSRFQQEAHRVDTKPCLVTSWEDFHRQQRKRRHRVNRRESAVSRGCPAKKDRGEQTLVPATTVPARAVHLRFVDLSVDEPHTKTTNSRSKEALNVDDSSRDDSSVSTRDSLATIEAEDSSRHADTDEGVSDEHSMHQESRSEPHSQYVWSDDEEEDGERTDSVPLAIPLAPSSPRLSLDSERNSCDGSSSSDSTQDRSGDKWADQGDEREKEEAKEDYHTKSNGFGRATGKANSEWRSSRCDEFATGLSDDGSNEVQSSEYDEMGVHRIASDNMIRTSVHEGDLIDNKSLQKDVESNLQILAQIFPSIGTQPFNTSIAQGAGPTTSGDGKLNQSSSEISTAASGWGPTGQMLRYDPSSQTSRSFVVSGAPATYSEVALSGTANDAAMTTTAAPNGGGVHDVVKIKAHGKQGGADGKNDDSKIRQRNLYQQDKLEAVFREAREDCLMQNVTPGAPKIDSGTFAFSFQVGGNDKGDTPGIYDTPQQSSSFSFAFGLGSSEPDTDNGVQSDLDEGAKHDDDSDVNDGPPIKRRYFGSAFSEEELDSYIYQFLTANGGDRILANVDEWRKDESIKAEWVKERTQLTLDWKRKHKAAKARRNSTSGKS